MQSIISPDATDPVSGFQVDCQFSKILKLSHFCIMIVISYGVLWSYNPTFLSSLYGCISQARDSFDGVKTFQDPHGSAIIAMSGPT